MANTRKPETIEADEAAGPVRRFSLADMPQWGDWLIQRLSERYAGFNPNHWVGRAQAAMSSNSTLFVRNERAVIMVSITPRAMDGSLVAIEDFALSRDATYQEQGGLVELPYRRDLLHRPLILLYHHAREWARAQKAQRLFVGQCSDLRYGILRDVLPSDVCGWVSVRLTLPNNWKEPK